MKMLTGFSYDPHTKTAHFDGYVAGTSGRVRRRKTVENVTRAQALEEWKKFRATLRNGTAIQGPATFKAFIEAYWPIVSAHLSPSVRINERRIIERHLIRFLGDTLLEKITSVVVGDLQTDMRNRGLSAAHINNTVRLLKTLLRQAVERDVIAEYPIKKKTKKEHEELPCLELSDEERRRFFASFDDEHAFRAHVAQTRKRRGRLPESEATTEHFRRHQEMSDFFLVAVETGLRNRSDLRNLRWREVDFKTGWIRVVMQKTKRVAAIPMSQACRAALERCRPKAGTSEYVFVDENGERLSYERIRRTFALAKAIAGITRRLRIHDLRHTFGSRLASGGVPLQIIAKALGHTTTKMAERYARPSEEATRMIVGALDRDALPTLPENGGAASAP